MLLSTWPPFLSSDQAQGCKLYLAAVRRHSDYEIDEIAVKFLGVCQDAVQLKQPGAL